MSPYVAGWNHKYWSIRFSLKKPKNYPYQNLPPRKLNNHMLQPSHQKLQHLHLQVVKLLENNPGWTKNFLSIRWSQLSAGKLQWRDKKKHNRTWFDERALIADEDVTSALGASVVDKPVPERFFKTESFLLSSGEDG